MDLKKIGKDENQYTKYIKPCVILIHDKARKLCYSRDGIRTIATNRLACTTNPPDVGKGGPTAWPDYQQCSYLNFCLHDPHDPLRSKLPFHFLDPIGSLTFILEVYTT